MASPDNRDFDFGADENHEAGKDNIFFGARHSFADDDQFKLRQEEEEY